MCFACVWLRRKQDWPEDDGGRGQKLGSNEIALLISKSSRNLAKELRLGKNRDHLSVLDLGQSLWEVVIKDGYCNEKQEVKKEH